MIDPATVYTREFFDRNLISGLASAQKILSVLFEMYRPETVLDVGCGGGAWLLAAKQLGVEVECLCGIDGPWAPHADVQWNLEERLPEIPRADLVICVEVAEHLSPERGPTLVEDLCRCGDMVLFSGATPGQGGELHLNERPHEYWIELFADHGMVCEDIIRPKVKGFPGVEYWYADNTFLFNRKQ